jgi:hypothetical protein
VLTDAQIFALANRGVPLPIPSYSGIGVEDYVSAWACNEKAGSPRKDSNTANANDLAENVPVDNRNLTSPALCFELPQAVYRVVTAPGTPGASTVKDSTYVSDASASYNETAIVTLREVIPGCATAGTGQTEGLNFSSSDPTIFTVDSEGVVNYVSDGGAAVILTTPDGRLGAVYVNVKAVTGNVLTFTEFVVASLAQDLWGSVAPMAFVDGTSDAEVAIHREMYTTKNHANAVYVRNPLNLYRGATTDTSCVAVWNSVQGNGRMGGTLITPLHIMYAAHYPFRAGDTLRFVDMTNGVHTVTVESVTTVAPDFGIARLTAPITACSFAKVLPAGCYATKLPGIANGIPIIGVNQYRQIFMNPFFSYEPNGSGLGYRYPFAAEFGVQRYGLNIINGDSGSPAFAQLDYQLVLLGCWVSGGSGISTDVAGNHAAINAALTALGGGYQLTDVDLSPYPTY